jgi:hypothetical protein
VLAVLQRGDPAMTGRVMSLFAVILLGGTAAGAPLTAAVITMTGPRAALAVSAIAAVAAIAGSRALVRDATRLHAPGRNQK